MKYPVSEISLLIDLMLSKASLPKIYSGLRELSEKIEDVSGDKSNPKSDKQHEYLYGILNEKIISASLKNKNEIVISDRYLNEYLNYLGYEDYPSFQQQFTKIKDQLDKLKPEEKKLRFLLPRSEKNRLTEKIEECFYPEQKRNYEVTDFDDTQNWKEDFFQSQEDTAFIWFIPPSFFQDEAVFKVLEENQEQVQFVPFWLTNKVSELDFFDSILNKDKQLLFDEFQDDLCLMIQMLVKSKASRKKEEPKPQAVKVITRIINQLVNRPLGNIDYRWSIGIYGSIAFIVLLIILNIKCPSDAQSAILRPSIAVATTGLFASLFSKWNEERAKFKLGIYLFLFLFIYLANPVSIAKGDNCNFYAHADGKVFLGDDPLKKALISLPHNDFQTLSNGSGEFSLRWENKEVVDSLLISIQSKGIDTSFYWKTEEAVLLVYLEDTLKPVTRKVIANLIESRIQHFEKEMQGNYLKWGIGEPIPLNQLIRLFRSFENKETYYRNEFLYKGIETELEFRKNLLEAGITAAKDLKPYQSHQFDSCAIYKIKSREFPDYQLEYLMVNQKPVDYKIIRLQHHADDRYSATLSFEENIRSIRVKLECSPQTEDYKIRQMEFYGFLPVETYEFKFKHGKWQLVPTTQAL